MDELIQLDRQLLLAFNGSDSLFWDNAMLLLTHTLTWLPLALVLLYIVLKNYQMRQVFIFLLMVGVLVLITDRVSSGLFKPYFHRLRPTHDPALSHLVDVCRGYRGGLYGFFSSHAANTFGLSTFVSLTLRHRKSMFALFSWAVLSSYTRIYLGVHFPGDILVGMLFGMLCGVLIFKLYSWLCVRYELNMQYYSEQYTPTGFLVDDCEMLPATFLATLVIVAICALW